MKNLKLINRKRNEALKYAKEGYRIIPIHGIVNGKCTCNKSVCKKPGKHPLTKNGYKDGTADLMQIKYWWKKWPWANVGMLLDEYCVLDVDPRNGSPRTIEELIKSYGNIPQTVTTLTGGGGYHLWFKKGQFKLKNADGKLGIGLDFRAVGYIVVPSSTHISSKPYEWSRGKSLFECHIADLPEWIIQKLFVPEVKIKEYAFTPKNQSYWNILDLISEGKRNATLTSLYGLLIQKKIDPRLAKAILHCVNNKQCAPILEHEEVEDIANSIAKRKLERITKRGK